MNWIKDRHYNDHHITTQREGVISTQNEHVVSYPSIYQIGCGNWKSAFLNHLRSLSLRSELIPLIAFEVVVDGFLCDLFVVLFHGGEVLSGFAELSLFHSLADVPVYECPLSVHEIEFVVHSAHYLCDGGGVGDHEH